ncbi:GntR family transcriptional regulator [Nonomuraea sp. K274]|uniref:GntR family transcriptional regulator n=2 Tax=Nonomuraea cypriaca TaxID=1187855 RepID=A0A931AKL1_9ACTN|nr:GntR family transcriptional regulator [Nonomuraea cypriaca]
MGREPEVDHIYLLLRQAIVSGRYPVGAQMTETALAEEHGVSRTPIREALRRLEQDGLVERSSRGGMRIRVWSTDEVFDLYEVRIVLEAQAAAISAERRTVLDLVRLRQANDTMRTADVDNGEQLREVNLAFHDALWHASHNLALIETLTRLQRQIMRHPANTLMYPGRWQDVLAEHDALIDAIEDGDSAKAHEIAATHMQSARDIRLRLYQ